MAEPLVPLPQALDDLGLLSHLVVEPKHAEVLVHRRGELVADRPRPLPFRAIEQLLELPLRIRFDRLRNLDRRVETLCPVRDREALSHLRDIVLGAYLRDTERAMVLESSGGYVKARGSEPFDAQAFLTRHYSDAIRD